MVSKNSWATILASLFRESGPERAILVVRWMGDGSRLCGYTSNQANEVYFYWADFAQVTWPELVFFPNGIIMAYYKVMWELLNVTFMCQNHSLLIWCQSEDKSYNQYSNYQK